MEKYYFQHRFAGLFLVRCRGLSNPIRETVLLVTASGMIDHPSVRRSNSFTVTSRPRAERATAAGVRTRRVEVEGRDDSMAASEKVELRAASPVAIFAVIQRAQRGRADNER